MMWAGKRFPLPRMNFGRCKAGSGRGKPKLPCSGSSPRLSAANTIFNLGLRTVAEGVETENVLNELKKMTCDVAQGYLNKPSTVT